MTVVLAVEDDPDHRNLLVLPLERAELRGHVVADGAQAVAVAQEEARPDLVVPDWSLPSPPETDACRRLRAAPGTAEVAVPMADL